MNPIIRKFLPLLIIVTSFLVAFLIWQYLVMPMRLNIQEKLDKMQELGIMRQVKRERIAELPELERQFSLIADQGKRLDVFAREEDIVRFIEMLEETAEESRAKIEIVAKEREKQKKKSSVPDKSDVKDAEGSEKKKKDESIVANLPFSEQLFFTITVHGDYVSVGGFLHRLETIPFAIDVLSFDIKRIENEELKKNAAASVDMVSASILPAGEGEATQLVPQEEEVLRNQVEGIFEIVVYIKR